jgi:hypothetical protein
VGLGFLVALFDVGGVAKAALNRGWLRSRHLARGGHRYSPRFSLDAQLIHLAAGGDVEKGDLVR